MVRRPCKHSEKNSLRILKTIIHPVFEKPEYSLDTVYVTNHGGNPRNNKNKSGNSCALRLSVPNSVATGTTAWSLAVLRNRRAPFVCRIIPCFWCTGSQPLPLSAAQTQRRAQPPSPVQLGNSPQLLELSSPIRLWKQAQCRWMGHTDCDDSTLFFSPPELQLTAFVIFFALQHFGTGLLRLTDQQKLQTPGLLSHKSCLSHVRLRWDPPRAENRTLPYSWMNTSTQTYHTPYYYLQYYLLSIAGHRLTSYLPPLTIIFRWEWKRTHKVFGPVLGCT